MSKFKRREFLKTISAAVAAPVVLGSAAKAAGNTVLPQPALRKDLPDIPTCESMRSVKMTHKFLDLYAWPGLTNQWGCAQSAMDVTAVRSIAFPPFAQGEMNCR